MNDKLIVVLDSILHLLLEERPIINRIKPAILMTPVDSLTLFVMSSFFNWCVQWYENKTERGVGLRDWLNLWFHLGSLGWIYLWYIVWWIKSVKSCSLHRSGLRPVAASLLESLVLLLVARCSPRNARWAGGGEADRRQPSGPELCRSSRSDWEGQICSILAPRWMPPPRRVPRSSVFQWSVNMFQCIIQQRNGWNRASPELKDVYPGGCFDVVVHRVARLYVRPVRCVCKQTVERAATTLPTTPALHLHPASHLRVLLLLSCISTTSGSLASSYYHLIRYDFRE